MTQKINTAEHTFSVSEFVNAMRVILQDKVGPVRIQGEVIDFRPRQGNLIFFELKDQSSRVSCFMMSWELKVPLADGLEVMIVGTPSLFKKSGRFHLKVIEVQSIGAGALSWALELLKIKLEKEGLFAAQRKRPLPQFPEKIGIITSPDAAAYADVLRILKNRWSGLDILLCPVNVQGVGSEQQIQEAFDYFNRNRNVDVIILARGGGSLEDLKSFNSEEVARAVFASQVPVVCGVGHERDVTIADLVADIRASTPSNAAERAVPHRSAVLFQIETYQKTIAQEIGLLIEGLSRAIDAQADLLERGIGRYQDRFLEIKHRLASSLAAYLGKIGFKKENLIFRVNFLKQNMQQRLQQYRQKVANRERIVNSLSPKKILRRGYAVVCNARGQVIKEAAVLKPGEMINTRFYQGAADSKIIKTSNE